MDIYDPNKKLVDRTKLAEEIKNKIKLREEEQKIKLTIENETTEQKADEEATASYEKMDNTNEDKQLVKKTKTKVGTSLMDATSSSEDEGLANTPAKIQSVKTQKRPSKARISRKARLSQAKELDGGVKNDQEDNEMEQN